MNISSAASFQTPYPQIAKASMEKNLTEKIEGPVIDEGRVMLTIEKLRTPGTWGITMDHLDELEEFLKTTNLGPGSGDLRTHIDSQRYTILWAKERRAELMLSDMEVIYTDFKRELQSKWPDLANKAFGFTVAEDGRLQVIAPPNTLDAWDEETLNSLLNGTKDLQSLTLKHAKAVIELVQLDKNQFEGKVEVSLTNFHKMVDYGLLLNKGALELGKTDSWLDQLHKNADMEQREKKQGFHIEA